MYDDLSVPYLVTYVNCSLSYAHLCYPTIHVFISIGTPELIKVCLLINFMFAIAMRHCCNSYAFGNQCACMVLKSNVFAVPNDMHVSICNIISKQSNLMLHFLPNDAMLVSVYCSLKFYIIALRVCMQSSSGIFRKSKL